MPGGRPRGPSRRRTTSCGGLGAGQAALDALHARLALRFRRPDGPGAGAALPGGAARPGRAQERPAAGRGDRGAPPAGRAAPAGRGAVGTWNAVRDDLRAYVVEHLGDPGAVLVVDETGFLKKVDELVGVQRQYRQRDRGAVGELPGGRLRWTWPGGGGPSWTGPGCPRAGPRTRPAPGDGGGAGGGALRHQAPAGQGAAGAGLRRGLSRPRGWPAIRCTGRTGGSGTGLAGCLDGPTRWPSPTRTGCGSPTGCSVRARAEVAQLPPGAWARRPAGEGAQGPRVGSTWVVRAPARRRRGGDWRRGAHWLLARRSVSDPTELAHHHACGPADTPLAGTRGARPGAGGRWRWDFEQAKGEVGLDQYEVRGWDGLAPPHHAPGAPGPRLPGGHPPGRRIRQGGAGGTPGPPPAPADRAGGAPPAPAPAHPAAQQGFLLHWSRWRPAPTRPAPAGATSPGGRAPGPPPVPRPRPPPHRAAPTPDVDGPQRRPVGPGAAVATSQGPGSAGPRATARTMAGASCGSCAPAPAGARCPRPWALAHRLQSVPPVAPRRPLAPNFVEGLQAPDTIPKEVSL